MTIPKTVQMVEVGPRDGLQNEKQILLTDDKVHLIESLVDAGVRHIEVGSFVRADLVPAMADTAEVYRRVQKQPGVRYTCLVPNEKGLDAALASGVKDIAIFTAASDTFNQKNINMTIAQSLDRIRTMVKRAKDNGLWVRGYISTAWHCPYEGQIAQEKVLDVVTALYDAGCNELSIGDTIGYAQPAEVKRLLELVFTKLDEHAIAVHFHDTRGYALRNILEAISMGVSIVDASVGGLGGCPFAPGAAGNVATESVVEMLDQLGITTGIDAKRLEEIATTLSFRRATH